MLEIIQFETVDEWLAGGTEVQGDSAETYMLQNEVVTGLPLGLGYRLRAGGHRYTEPPYFAIVKEAGQIVLTAIQTPPHNIIVYSHLQDGFQPALALLAQTLAEQKHTLPGCNGVEAISDGFAAAWTAQTAIPHKPSMHLRCYQLHAVTPIDPVSGSPRTGTKADIPLLAEWVDKFSQEAIGASPNYEAAAILVRNGIARNEYLIWEDGEVVSIAKSTRPTPTGITISSVYTPPQFRGHGYASACVAVLSQQLLDSGYTYCTLFTDLANPTSNSIYQKIGYRPVCDFREHKFG